MEKKHLLKNSTIIKAAAAMTAVALITAASLLPAKTEPAQITDPNLINPAPVVMTLEEPAEAVIEEEAEEEEKKHKLNFFQRLKMAFIGFFVACGAWLASRIPWRKIFNKRNAIIVLVLAACILLAYYVGMPMLEK